jgi:DUF4097 and DUF4098 domain-containing protein YvlB
MQHSFDTAGPTSLYVEIGSGDVHVTASEVFETTVTVTGQDADDTVVEQRGNQIVVLAPRRRGLFGGDHDLSVSVVLPTDSDLATKVGSADLAVTGRLGTCRVRSGSGDVRLDDVGAEASVETGSGDISIESVTGDLRVKSGSGDVQVDRLGSDTSISTGSGDIELGTAQGAVQVKSGSGDMRLREAHTDVAMSTASGDVVVGTMHRGAFQAKNVSGDIRVGVPANVPVWTDISCVTGQVSSDLQGAGQPEEGQDYVEIRATTVSGDIHLEEL